MATIMGCVLYHPTPLFSNTWKLLSIQRLVPAQRGICIGTEGEGESVYKQSSLVSGWRPPRWIMLPNNGCGLSQSEHAPIARRRTNMPLSSFTCSPSRIDIVPLADAGQLYVFILTNWCPVLGERQIKKSMLSLFRPCCSINGITRGAVPSFTTCLWKDKIRPLWLWASLQ